MKAAPIAAIHRTTINLYPTHHFVNTIRFNRAHSQTRLTTMSDEVTTFYEELAAIEYTYHIAFQK
jgi:hypothetical protein